MIKIRGCNREISSSLIDIWIDPNKVDIIVPGPSNTHNFIYINGVSIRNVPIEYIDSIKAYRLGEVREQQIKTVLDE